MMRGSGRWSSSGVRATLAVAVVSAVSGWYGSGAAQTVEQERAVMAPIHRLFDAMRTGDSAQARAAFGPFARLSRAPGEDGEFQIDDDAIERFIGAIGGEREEVWDERIWDWDVKVDGHLASVWVPYAFYIGERLSHCGVDAFQLVRLRGEWKIVHVMDTRRAEACPAARHR